MRFKVDENIPRAAVDLLVEKGHDVQTVADEELVGETDLRVAGADLLGIAVWASDPGHGSVWFPAALHRSPSRSWMSRPWRYICSSFVAVMKGVAPRGASLVTTNLNISCRFGESALAERRSLRVKSVTSHPLSEAPLSADLRRIDATP